MVLFFRHVSDFRETGEWKALRHYLKNNAAGLSSMRARVYLELLSPSGKRTSRPQLIGLHESLSAAEVPRDHRTAISQLDDGSINNV